MPTSAARGEEADEQPARNGGGDRDRRYVPIGEVARGGMGTVLHVWDTVLHRPLAMKVLAGGNGTGESGSEDWARAAARFLREARVTGQLAHPGIVPIHDLQVGDGERVAFTMDLIEGVTLDEVFDRVHGGEGEGRWTVARGTLVMLKVCQIVAHAHSRGVIHRDLNPSNVMVGSFGEIYVVDWGLAKVVGIAGGERGEPRAGRQVPDPDGGGTIDGSVFGTPSYMSPEQARGETERITHLTDVYAAGAMLYHLLTGRKPYATPRGRTDPETILRLARRGPPTPVAKLAARAPAELVAICERAMARRPEARYASMTELADDLAAFLEGRVVAAYEQGFVAEVKKLVQRNRLVATSTLAAVLVAALAMAAVTWVHAASNRRLELKNLELEGARAAALESALQARRMADEAERRRVEAERRRYLANVATAATSAETGATRAALRRLEDVPADARGWEWHHLALRADGSVARRWISVPGADAGPTVPVGLEVVGERLLVIKSDGSVDCLSVEEGIRAAMPMVEALDGRRVAAVDVVTAWNGRAATRDRNGRIAAWDTELGEPVLEVTESGATCMAFYEREELLVSGHEDGAVRAWDAEGSARVVARVPGAIEHVAVDGAGRVAVASAAGDVHVVDLGTGESLFVSESEGAPVVRVAFDETGDYLAAGGDQGRTRILDAASWDLVVASEPRSHGVTALAATEGAGRFVVGYGDGRLEIRDAHGAAKVLPGHVGEVTDVCTADGGATVYSASADGSVRAWDARGPAAESSFAHHDLLLRAVAFSPGGGAVAVASADGHVLRYDASTGRLTATWSCGSGVTALAHVDEDTIAAGTIDGGIELCDARTGSSRTLATGGDGGGVLAIVVLGGRVVAASSDGAATVWDAGSGEVVRRLEGHGGPVVALAAGSGSGSVASASTDGTVRVWALATGEHESVHAGNATVRALAFHPHGASLAIGDERGRIFEVPLGGGSPSRELTAHEGVVHALSWSPDGSRLASASEDGSIRVWLRDVDEPVLVDRGHGAPVRDVAFDPGGHRLAGVSAPEGLRVLESGGAELRWRARLAERERGAREPRFAKELALGRAFRAQRLRRRAWDLLLARDSAEADRQGALVLAREVALLEPDARETRAVLGAAYVQNGMESRAVGVLRESLDEARPAEMRLARAFLGIALCRLGERAESTELARAVRREPDGDDPRVASVLEELEACLRRGER